jgi:hypothetical protein
VRVGGQLEDAEQQQNLNKYLEPAAEMLPSDKTVCSKKAGHTTDIWVTMRYTDAHDHAGPESDLPTTDLGCEV